MQGNTVIGIDPGLRGAIVAITTGSGGITQAIAFKMPLKRVGRRQTNEIDVLELSRILSPLSRAARVFLEEIIPMPKQGVIGTQTVGKNFGRLTGCLEMLSFNYELVRPQIWQSAVAKLTGLRKVEGITSKLQARLWAKAIASHTLIPQLASPTPHDGLVDAFLIAYSGVS